MSMTTTYACDHCGAPCNGNVYASLWGDGDETKAYKHTRLDGCSQEHLGLVVAKSFGIGIDGKATELLIEKNNKLASLQGELLEERNARQNAQRDERAVREQLSEARNHAAALEGLANQYRAERDHLEETCRMLREKTKPPVDSEGKSPGQVMTDKAHELFYAPDTPDAPFAWDRLSKAEQSRANETAMAVLRAFGQDVVEALRRVRINAVKQRPYVSETERAGIDKCINIIDSEFASLEGKGS